MDTSAFGFKSVKIWLLSGEPRRGIYGCAWLMGPRTFHWETWTVFRSSLRFPVYSVGGQFHTLALRPTGCQNDSLTPTLTHAHTFKCTLITHSPLGIETVPHSAPITTLPPPETLEQSVCSILWCSYISSQAVMSWKFKRNSPGCWLGLEFPFWGVMRFHRSWAGAHSSGTRALPISLHFGTGEGGSMGPLHAFPPSRTGESTVSSLLRMPSPPLSKNQPEKPFLCIWEMQTLS